MSVLGFTNMLLKSSTIVCTPPSTYATLDPSRKGANVTLSNGNLTAANSTGPPWYSVFGTRGASTGKFYTELLYSIGGSNPLILGVGNTSSPLTNYVGSDSNGWGYYGGPNPSFYHSASGIGSLPSTAVGDIMMMAVDVGAGKIWWGRNGAWYNSANPSTGLNPVFSGLSGTLYPIVSVYVQCIGTINFGATTYSYTPPNGFCYW